ncbi:phytanoyl-CoA dioxygenase family protein [Pelagibacterales bacterium SAG-MED22]|nr:phytanoyl-CoA dioxygenase family protein [Pelagibacterales bacterium SAG-MED22]
MQKNNFLPKVSNYLKKNHHMASKVDHKILSELGFLVLKNAFKKETIEKYSSNYNLYLRNKKISKTKTHPVEVRVDQLNFFKNFLKESQLKKVVKNFYKGNVGSDYFRIVKKDKINSAPVFCHQDVGYQIGTFDRYSLFICLTNNNSLNGGMVLYPSTHKFGYLADTGEISKKITKNFIKICPDLEIGDVLIMHSSLWHESGKNFNMKDRVYLEIHIQDANEPSTKFVIIGKNKNKNKFPFDTGSTGRSINSNIFSNSRVQRVIYWKNKAKKLQKIINIQNLRK